LSRPLLAVHNVSAGYGRLPALHHVSFGVRRGEIACLLGPNGAGKTTLMRVLSGVFPPWEGTIRFKDANVAGMPAERVVRMGLAHVPQERHIFSTMTVRENLMIGATPILHRRPAPEIAANLAYWSDRFRILADRADQPAGLLSGGEQQLLAICRALMSEPDLLLMDEPSLGLSPAATELCFGLIAELRASGKTILLVEQDEARAKSVADSVYVMNMGELSAYPGPALANGAESQPI
jgi:branched-chain amino acid transport system ATP-binding protein